MFLTTTFCRCNIYHIGGESMHIVIVNILVKKESVSAFIQETLLNAKNSLDEPGIVRFDVLQESSNPCRFHLFEVYRTSEDQAKHRETQHYHRWKAEVAEMMAEPRQGLICSNLFPCNEEW